MFVTHKSRGPEHNKAQFYAKQDSLLKNIFYCFFNKTYHDFHKSEWHEHIIT